MEAVLREIWCKTLGVDAVSGSSNFFIEGGDSTKLVQLAIAIKQELAVEVPLMAIFEAQSFGNLTLEVGKRVAERSAR